MALLARFGHASDAVLERIFIEVFKCAEIGTLHATFPSGHTHVFDGKKPDPRAQITITNWQMMRAALTRGDIGFGESYIDGHWHTPDIGVLMTYMVYNLEAIGKVVHANPLMRRIFQAVNWLRRNTKENSRANIRAHYDVGNDFYRLWLDETMTYSSALFDAQDQNMSSAQRAKYGRLLDHVGAEPSRILEIGCGWGGFAEEALKRGHHVTGLTLSTEQLGFAKERLKHGLAEEKLDLRLQDYRDVRGTFDHIVSIEMFEAVGEQYWPIYFQTIANRLRKGGKAMIQTITIDHAFFDDYRRRSDFIRHYTFPGGLLPSLPRLKQEIEKAGLICRHVFAFGQDYARTLSQWLSALDARTTDVLALGYTEEFIRSWRFYLGCCIGSFTAGRTDVMQLEIVHA